ncbi:MAG TPA: hypothetical protein VMW10_05965 [Alphaproteobacteria bacterium]|nr:hypothetical protein [Alphaproteobacteria bacterium]
MSPYRAGRPCLGYGPRRGGCPNLVKGIETYCPDCLPYTQAENKKYDKKRDQTPERRFLHSTTWRRIRDYKLSIDPLCERCQKQGLTVPAVLVHHKDGNELNNHRFNHESLCNACHELEHKDKRWGK